MDGTEKPERPWPPVYGKPRRRKWVRRLISGYFGFWYLMTCLSALTGGPHEIQIWNGALGVLYAILFVTFL